MGYTSLTDSKTISDLDNILNCIKSQDRGLEKILQWFLLDRDLNKIILQEQNIRYNKGQESANRHSITAKYSYIAWEIQQTNIFKDYLIDDKNNYNAFKIDYEYIKEYTHHDKRDVDNILLKIGAVEKFEELTIKRVQELLQQHVDKNIKSGVQNLYKNCIQYYSKNKQSLNAPNIKLLAKKGSEYAYFDSTEVYYSDKKLPNYILKNNAIIDLPKRIGTQQVKSFFGIEEPQFDTQVTDFDEHEYITRRKFQEKFDMLKPYILAYRCM